MEEIDEKSKLVYDKSLYKSWSYNYESRSGSLLKMTPSKTISFKRYKYDDDEEEEEDNEEDDEEEKSCWMRLCMKLREKEVGPGWEPSYWQSICPYPFCPTYRHIARIVALLLLILLAWGIVFCVIGQDAAPGGQLFDIAMLCLAAHCGGWLFRLINLPGLVGMLVVGVTFQNFGLVNVHINYPYLTAVLRKIALVIILTRAGLDMNPVDMKKLFCIVLTLGLVPWFVECAVAALVGYYLLGLPLMWAILMGSVIGAVSPAVVVPILFRLRTKGYGVAKGIPTLVIAAAGIDDAASVAAFGIVFSIMFSKHSLMYNILLGPVTILVGLGFSIVWSVVAQYIPEKSDASLCSTSSSSVDVVWGVIAVFGSERLGLGGAGPLGVVAAAFGSASVWHTQGWTLEHNPIASIFAIFWMIFEPILFSLTGTQIEIAKIDINVLTIITVGLLAGVIIRILVTIMVGINSPLNLKEKLCCALFWMNKASVQAALGPIVVDYVAALHTKGPEKHYASIILMYCVMSVVLTAPVGAFILTLFGSRLLSKTEPRRVPLRHRSTLLSLRDVSVRDRE